jgi:hypothetical protein
MSLSEAWHLIRGIALIVFFVAAVLQKDGRPRRTAESYRKERLARRAIARRERESRPKPARKRRTYRLR